MFEKSLEDKIGIATNWGVRKAKNEGLMEMIFKRKEYEKEDARQEASLRAWRVLEKGGTLSNASIAAYRGIQDYIREKGNLTKLGNRRSFETISFCALKIRGKDGSFSEFDVESDFDLEDSSVNTELGKRLLEHLDERSREIMLLHYSFDYTLKEIAEMYDVSESRVYQIIENSERKMRNACESGNPDESVSYVQRKTSSCVDERWIYEQIC